MIFKEFPIQVPTSVQDFNGSIDVGVRPFGLSHDVGGISAVVMASEYLGTTQIVSLQVDQTILKLASPPERNMPLDQQLIYILINVAFRFSITTLAELS